MVLLSLQLGKQYMKRGTNMKRLISLILVMLMSTSAVFASSFSDADIKKVQDNKVSYFTYLGSNYLLTTEITQI